MDETKLLIIVLGLPDYFNNHPYPSIINMIINRLSEAFVSCTCPLKVQISRAVAKCQSHLHLIKNFGEIVSRLSNVLYSTDPVERAAVLIIFSALAVLIKSREVNEISDNNYILNSLYHQLIVSLQSRDAEEANTAVLVSYKFVKYSPYFSRLLLDKINDVLQRDQGVFDQLLGAYSYMNHDFEMANMAFGSLVKYSSRFPEKSFRAMSKLAIKNPFIVEEYISFCFDHLLNSNERHGEIILKNLTKIARFYPFLFDLRRIDALFKRYQTSHCFYILYLLIRVAHRPALLFIKQNLEELLRWLETNNSMVLLFILADYMLGNDESGILQHFKLLSDRFEAFLLNYSSLRLESTRRFLCCCYTRFLVKLPRSLLIKAQIPDFIMRLCFCSIIEICPTQLTRWLYIVHVSRAVEMSGSNFLNMQNQILEMFKNKMDVAIFYKFINFAIIYQYFRGVGDYDWLKDILDDIGPKEAYGMGVVSTLFGCFNISYLLFQRILSFPIHKIDFKRHLVELTKISAMETDRFKPDYMSSILYKFYGARSHFQKSYIANRKRTLELGQGIFSLFNANPIEFSGPFIQSVIKKYINDAEVLRADWLKISKFMYDSDGNSRHLIQAYATIINILSHLLNYKNTNVESMIEFMRSLTHPFASKMIEVLDVLKSQNIFSGIVANFVLNAVLKPWPLPLYYYKSSFKLKTAINFKETHKESLLSDMNHSKVGETFNFSVEGYFKVDSDEIKKKIKYVCIKNIEIVASIFCCDSDGELLEQFIENVTLNNGYFDCNLAINFDKAGNYKISVFVDSIMDEMDQCWEIQQFKCPDIYVNVSGRTNFSDLQFYSNKS
ncbi:Integrator complex subunit 7 [Thelohanellus kitauei]|uniref:Integrator complex subunit 7 n=1 Tax=Thelohanellus kitauei TaxID=669202 RepID=A0A0C2N2B3_THEKT|nr:Integrator complex subunit 7 [Thelohanellus kitauei]